MKKIISLCLIVFATISWAQKPIFTTAKTKSVTVFYSGAELKQTITVTIPVGTHEIVVKNIANQLNENTLQVGVPNSVTILSSQFTQNYISEYEIDENNPQIKKVRDSIAYYKNAKLKVSNEKNALSKTIELLDKNQQIGNQNSSMAVAELMKLVDYYTAKRTQISNSINGLTEKEIALGDKIEKLEAQLAISEEKEENVSNGKLILQVMNEIAGSVTLNLTYITNAASWQPFYDLRAENATEPIAVSYKAKVSQNTGIDWKKIKLSLSNGNPNQNNNAPLLQAWFLRYGNYKNFENRPNANVTNTLQGQLAGVNISGASGQPGGSKDKVIIRGVGSINGNSDPLYIIDGIPQDVDTFKNLPTEFIKNVSVLKDEESLSAYGNRGANGVIIITTKNMNDYTSIEENELNISFDIDVPYDILSNGKMHSVALKEFNLPATYKYYAVPKLDKEAFLLAELNEYGKYNLLPGEANIIFEGVNVGKTTINPNQTQELLNLSMGRDKKISIKREKVADKSGTKFLSSYKEQTFTYDITVRNNKKDAINLMLKDQYPLSSDEDITVEIEELSGANENKETGVLTWELKLNSNETKKIRISYKVKYPKDKFIDNL